MNAKEKIEAGLLQQTRHKGDAADEALALLQDCVVIPKDEVPERLAVNIANIEGNVELGDFLRPDLDALIAAARTILKHSGGDTTRKS